MKRKVCKKCKLFVEGNECPICKGSQFSSSWQGRLNILDANKSVIADKIGIKVKGEYAIKVR
ncbi:DNA-directed RNA polymerase subunit E'' [Candidatus Woesearchaeota archaeon]|nr:DNA-directed RNA polymerase subunit E'' [Candidatus Woesearchaeota archaeon]